MLPARDFRTVALGLFLFLMSVYLLNYSGSPHSSDGIAMLATAESLVRRGELDMNAYLWMGLQQGSFGPDGELYSRKGMGQVLAALPLAWLGLRVPAFGLVQTAMLLSPLVAAATALCLYTVCLRLGFGTSTALTVGLAYGLATPALPYSKYFFSDPLTGLALMAALLAALSYRRHASVLSSGACGACLGFAALTRSTSLALVPLFALGLWRWRSRPGSGEGGRFGLQGAGSHLASFAASVAAFLALMGSFNYLRYGDPLVTGYLPQESFSGDWVQGTAGLLVSPGRGLFLYAPILLLAIPGWLALRRRDPAVAWLGLGVFAAHGLIYGKWFMWHGGYCWGPRFLLPAVPFLMLALAPLWERGSMWRRAAVALPGVSLVPQLRGSVVSFAPFQDSLLASGLPLFDPRTFRLPRYSPLLGQWQYLHARNLDFAWAQGVDGAPQVDWLLLAGLSGTVLLSAAALAQAAAGKGRRLLVMAALAVALAVPFLLARAEEQGRHPLDRALRLVEGGERRGGAFLLARPTDSLVVSDRYRGLLPCYGLPADAPPWLDRLSDRYRNLWLLRDDAALAASAAELWLSSWGYQLATHTGGAPGGPSWRLVRYGRPRGELSLAATEEPFQAGITLAEAALAREGEVLFLRLQWRADRALVQDYKVFVHAYDAQGELLAQHDSMPALWQRPTTTWSPGETVEDRHALLLPAGKTCEYLLLGLYEPDTGRRLPLADGRDAVRIP